MEYLKLLDIKFEDFYSSLTNFKDPENAKMLSKLLENKDQYPEILFIIEMFFQKKLNENEKLIVEYFELKIGKEIKFLLYFLFDILIKNLKENRDPEIIRKILFAQIDDKNSHGFLHSLFWYDANYNENSIETIFTKLKEIKKYFPETIFKQLFLLRRKDCGFTFMFCISNISAFKIVFDFIKFEFDEEFLKELLCCDSSRKNWIW
jgi:hypothetical protein